MLLDNNDKILTAMNSVDRIFTTWIRPLLSLDNADTLSEPFDIVVNICTITRIIN